MYIKETKKRTVYKSVTWRMVAIINSWAILSFSMSKSNLINALLMNLTGFFIFYIFERVWTRIKYGRTIINEQ
jgi:uncharacterized membrane protein